VRRADVRGSLRRCTAAVAALIALASHRPLWVVAQEAGAHDIQLLLLRPHAKSDRVQAQLEDFARAIIASGGPLTIVEQLDEADVVVQFTDYRRKLTKDGKPQQRWSGTLKVVEPPQARSRRPPVPEHFSIVVTGPDAWGQRKAVTTFRGVLAKALGREQPREPPEDI
jgi:hypothetical protein